MIGRKEKEDIKEEVKQRKWAGLYIVKIKTYIRKN